jgi:hypothetical protein
VGWLCKFCNKPDKRSSIVPATPISSQKKLNPVSGKPKNKNTNKIISKNSSEKSKKEQKSASSKTDTTSAGVSQLKSPVPSTSKSTSDLENQLSSLQSKITILEEQIRNLQLTIGSLEKEKKLSENLNVKHDFLEQKLVDKNVEILGFSLGDITDPFIALSEVCRIVFFDLDPSKILNCFLINNSGNGQNKIIVEFSDKLTQLEFIKAGKSARRRGVINFYINQQLTSFKKKLLYNCKQFARLNSFKFAWSCFSTIYLKKDDFALPIKINCDKDLIDLRNSLTQVDPQNESLLSERAWTSY